MAEQVEDRNDGLRECVMSDDLKRVENIIKILDPLSDREKRRTLLFFWDAAHDPDASPFQIDILKAVASNLKIDLPE